MAKSEILNPVKLGTVLGDLFVSASMLAREDLAGLLVEPQQNGVVLMATNGHTLAWVSMPWELAALDPRGVMSMAGDSVLGMALRVFSGDRVRKDQQDAVLPVEWLDALDGGLVPFTVPKGCLVSYAEDKRAGKLTSAILLPGIVPSWRRVLADHFENPEGSWPMVDPHKLDLLAHACKDLRALCWRAQAHPARALPEPEWSTGVSTRLSPLGWHEAPQAFGASPILWDGGQLAGLRCNMVREEGEGAGQPGVVLQALRFGTYCSAVLPNNAGEPVDFRVTVECEPSPLQWEVAL